MPSRMSVWYPGCPGPSRPTRLARRRHWDPATCPKGAVCETTHNSIGVPFFIGYPRFSLVKLNYIRFRLRKKDVVRF